MDKPIIRVMLVDDHQMVRNGLATFLLVHDDLELVAEAADGQEALLLFEQAQPDVVLMDLKMPRMDGVEAIRALVKRAPHVRVIALTSFGDEEMVQNALEAGAGGYLLKDIGADDLANAIRKAYAGKPALADEVAEALFRAARQGPRPGDDLTEREREVLALMVAGLTNPEIGEKLFVSLSTVKTHVSNILSKLGVSTRTEAVSFALQNKIVTRE
jgi:NarL family two-component system response regulator LiaR